MLVRLALLTLLSCGVAHADLLITVVESGGDVVLTLSGTYDMTGVTAAGTSTAGGGISGSSAIVAFGSGGTDTFAIVGPSSFGTGGFSGGTGSASPPLFINGSVGLIGIPSGTTSGSLSNTSTISGASFASLGLTEGSYVYTWGAGGTDEVATVTIGAVPEPNSLALVGIAGALVALRRRRSR